jgi:hypothetical protein
VGVDAIVRMSQTFDTRGSLLSRAAVAAPVGSAAAAPGVAHFAEHWNCAVVGFGSRVDVLALPSGERRRSIVTAHAPGVVAVAVLPRVIDEVDGVPDAVVGKAGAVQPLRPALMLLGDTDGALSLWNVASYSHKSVFSAKGVHALEGSSAAAAGSCAVVALLRLDTPPSLLPCVVSVARNGAARLWFCRYMHVAGFDVGSKQRAPLEALCAATAPAMSLLAAWSMRRSDGA